MTDYKTLNAQLSALVKGVPHPVANLANAAALLYHTLDGLNWAGFYLLEGDTLVLGPFQGRPACIEIPVGRGVCGAAVAEGKTQLVPDVHEFPGHIACDSASSSEIVVPIHVGSEIVGVLDLVSAPMRFCSFSANRKCRKMAGKGVQPLNNYTCRFRPSSLKQADKSGLDGLQTGK